MITTAITATSSLIRHDGSSTGAENMALDLELLDLVRSGELNGAFRTYTWEPWCVSLGKHQSLDVVDAERLASVGYDVINRPTGGRAVFHAEELTYCIVSRGDPRVIYKRMHEILQNALVSILQNDVKLESDAHRLKMHYASGTDLGQACFAANAQNEIVFNGRKIVGSAQRIIDGVVLQHGSILCGDAHLQLADLLRMNDDRRDEFRQILRNSSISLTEALGTAITPNEIRESIKTQELEIEQLLATSNS